MTQRFTIVFLIFLMSSVANAQAPSMELDVRVVRAACSPRRTRGAVRARALGNGRVRVELRDYFDWRAHSPSFRAVLTGSEIHLQSDESAPGGSTCTRTIVLELADVPPGRYAVFATLDRVPIRTEPRHGIARVTVPGWAGWAGSAAPDRP
jgi:hypothetical protein